VPHLRLDDSSRRFGRKGGERCLGWGRSSGGEEERGGCFCQQGENRYRRISSQETESAMRALDVSGKVRTHSLDSDYQGDRTEEGGWSQTRLYFNYFLSRKPKKVKASPSGGSKGRGAEQQRFSRNVHQKGEGEKFSTLSELVKEAVRGRRKSERSMGRGISI